MDRLRSHIILFSQTAIQWNILLLAFITPTLFYLRTYDSAMVKITAAQLGTLSLLAFWVVKTVELGRLEWPVPVGKLLRPAFLLLVWMICSYCLSDFKVASMQEFLKPVLFLLVFCIVAIEFSGLSSAKRLIDWILAATWVVTIYGLMQWVDFNLFENRGILDPFIWRGAFGHRVFSTLANPELLACFLVGVYPLALANFLISSHWRAVIKQPDTGEPGYQSNILVSIGSLRYLLALILLPLMVFILMESWSVKGLLAFISTLIFFAVLAGKFLKDKVRHLSFALAGLTLLALAIYLPIGHQKLLERMNYDMVFLKHTWSGTLQMIKKNPILGTGPGSFWVVYPEFRKPEIIQLEGRHNTETRHPENELLEIWSELGLIGVIFFAWLFWNIFSTSVSKIKKSIKEGPQEDTIFLIGLFSSVFGLFATGMINALGTRFIAPSLHFWLLAGVLGGVVSTYLERNMKFRVYPFPINISASRLIYLPVLAMLIIAGYASIRWFQSDVKLNYAIFFSKQGDWDNALSHYGQIIPGHDSYILAQYFMGNVYSDQGKVGEKHSVLYQAVNQFLKVKKLAPHYVQVNFRLGNVYSLLKRWDEAIQSYLASEKLDPIFKENYIRLALAYMNKGERSKVSEVYKRFNRYYPNQKMSFEGKNLQMEN